MAIQEARELYKCVMTTVSPQGLELIINLVRASLVAQ